MKQFSLIMSLVDFIPVICFLIAAVILQRDLYHNMSKGAFALFAAGTIDVFCAGALKAIYKALYALNICDFEPLSQMFFPVQSIGFLLAGLGVIAMLTHNQGHGTKAFAVAPIVWKGTPFFVTLMILGLAGMDIGLMVIAKRKKKYIIVPVYLVSFFCCLMMGYLSSRNFDKAILNWMAEVVNVLGQGMFLLGAVLLHKAGLGKDNLEAIK